jgi:hypothetical protein
MSRRMAFERKRRDAQDMRRILMLAILASGCSIALQSKPSKGRNECSSSPMLAVVDTVVMVAAVGAGVAGVVIGGDTGNVTTGVSLMTGIGYLASADNGFTWAGKCRELQSAPAPVASR